MLDEGNALDARFVTESVRRRIAVVDDHEALKAAGMGGYLINSLDRNLGQRSAAGNPHRVTADGAAHALAGRFADLRYLVERYARRLGRRQDRMSQRVLRVAFQTRNQAKDV